MDGAGEIPARLFAELAAAIARNMLPLLFLRPLGALVVVDAGGLGEGR